MTKEERRVLKAAMRLYRGASWQYGPYSGEGVLVPNNVASLREWDRACAALERSRSTTREQR